MDPEVKELQQKLLHTVLKYKYSYNFTWFGRPIIQLPDDVMAIQELILSIKPDLIIETGVAHGGSLVFSASMLELLGKGKAVGIEIDLRPHNKKAIETHPLAGRLQLIQGSSTDESVVKQVRNLAEGKSPVIVMLDSNHTHEHVLRELEAYSPLVTNGGYLVVLDTVIEDLPDDAFPDQPWGKGNNPKTAVWEFLERNNRFIIDKDIENKLLISVAPDGYLKCIGDP